MSSAAPPPPPPGYTPPPVPPSHPLTPPPSPGGRGIGLGIVIGVLVFALIAGGAYAVVALRDSGGSSTSNGPVKPLPSEAMPSTDPALAKFYDQKLDWISCTGDNVCAKLTVPLDYDKPDGETVKLALIKVPAKGKSLGPLVVNPGGPGGSGVQYAQGGSYAFSDGIIDHYDVVGFDPRGVGESLPPLNCFDTEQMDTYLAQDQDPDTAEERDAYAQSVTEFGDACLKNSGELPRHMSTEETVRDVDVLRQALGQAKLTYLGASYGTSIGAQYAKEFPDRVGRMVLDGAVDQDQDAEQASLTQAKGFETAIRAYVQDCIDQGDCFLGDTVDEGTKRIADFVKSTETDPLPVQDGRTLHEGNALTGVLGALYSQQLWPPLTQGLQQAFDKGDGTVLMALFDSYASRTDSGYDSLLRVFQATSCLDDDEGIDIQDVPKYYAEFDKASPTFGDTFAYGLSICRYWPIKSGTTPPKSFSVEGAPPIVVLGTTRDPATPYSSAVELAKDLGSGVLVTRDGDGHTALGSGNTCIDDTVDAYLVGGTVPKAGTKC